MKAVRFATIAALASLAACGDALVGPAASTDRGSLFDDLWRQVDLHYSFFTLKRINWDSIGNVYRPQALAAKSDAEFAGVAGRMLNELKDAHVSITPAGGGTIRYRARFELEPTFFDARRVFQRYVAEGAPAAGTHIRFGKIAPSTGYIYIPSFLGTGWAGEVDAALAAPGNVTRMIVDVRDNGGGTNALALDIAGRFTDRTRTFGYMRRRSGPGHDDFTGFNDQTVSPAGPAQFTGPVFVLSNRHSASSSEDFVRAMSAMPHATIVGDTTAGAAGGPIVRELINGWTYQLSEWIEYTLDRATFEDVGLAPDVLVKATAADADPILERAIALASR